MGDYLDVRLDAPVEPLSQRWITAALETIDAHAQGDDRHMVLSMLGLDVLSINGRSRVLGGTS